MNELDSVEKDPIEKDQLNQEDLEIVAGGDGGDGDSEEDRPPILVNNG